MIVGQRKSSYVVLSITAHEMRLIGLSGKEASVQVDGEMKSKALAESIGSLWKQIQVDCKNVVVQLGEEWVQTRVVEMNAALNEYDIEKELRVNAEEYFGQLLENVYFDFVKLPSSNSSLEQAEILLVSVSRERVAVLIDAIFTADLCLQALRVCRDFLAYPDVSEINLLPWRESARQYRTKQLIVFLILIFCFIVGILFCCYLHNEHQLMIKKKGNEILQAKIIALSSRCKAVDNLIAEKNLLVDERIFALHKEHDQVNFSQLLKFLEHISPALMLTALKKRNDQVTLWGIAKKDEAVSALLQQLSGLRWVQYCVVNALKNEHNKRHFEIMVFLRP